MAHGPIPDGELVREVKRLGFEPTPAQVRWLETDVADGFTQAGKQCGEQMRAGAHAAHKAANAYGRVLLADLHALQKAATQ
jgi:hypothetical protein